MGYKIIYKSRQLDQDELIKANILLDEIRTNLEKLSGGDKSLLFAYRRKIFKELTYDERGKPNYRRKLKKLKRTEQNIICPLCNKELPEKYTVLDRFKAEDGYTVDNTRLIHQKCDYEEQQKLNFK